MFELPVKSGQQAVAQQTLGFTFFCKLPVSAFLVNGMRVSSRARFGDLVLLRV